MHQQDFFHMAFIYLLAAVISVPVAKRLGFGSVLGYLVAGIVIGPFALGLIGKEGEDVMHFAEFGVVMMLFIIGLEMKPNLLWQMRRSIFGMGGIQLTATALVIALAAILLGLSPKEGIAIGLMLGLSSTAIVLQTLAEKNLMKQAAGQASFSVLLLQDIAVVPILAILPLLAIHPSAALLHGEEIRRIGGMEVTGWFQVLMILMIFSGIVIAGRYLARYLFRIIARTGLREIFTAMALLLVIASAILMDLVGLSPALGAFLAGVVLANNEYRHELEADIEPFKGLLLGLFFISVGASINFNLLVESPWMILGLLGLLIGIKFTVLFLLGRFFSLRGGQNTLFAFSLAQGGEFAFVLVSFSLENGVVSSQVSAILFVVVALSMAVTPLLLLFNDRVVQPRLEKPGKERDHDVVEVKDNPVIIAGFDDFGVVIGRFLIANGIRVTILDDNPNNIDGLKKFGFKVHYGDASRPDLLKAAGGGNARVIVVAVGDKQKSLGIIDQVQRNYPNLKVVARAMNVDHTYELLRRKVEESAHNSFESSLQLGMKVLTSLGYQRYRVYRLGRIFRKHQSEVIRDLCQHHGEDEKKYLSEAKKHAIEVEGILRAEQENTSYQDDHSWDDSTQREESLGLLDGRK
ncbi:MAG: potassium transporter [Bacteroidetes bacterium]|nr:potassium transporter [Bacteroidota bacterium]